jgi:hypothetical protein
MTFSQRPLTPSQRALLPEDKHDNAAVTHLFTVDETAIAPLVRELLAWLQDPNWPIFLPIRELLQQHPELVVEPVREVLKGDDDEWKNHCLEHIVKHIPRKYQFELKEEIERIAKTPTAREKVEEADEIAKEILDKLRNDL